MILLVEFIALITDTIISIVLFLLEIMIFLFYKSKYRWILLSTLAVSIGSCTAYISYQNQKEREYAEKEVAKMTALEIQKCKIAIKYAESIIVSLSEKIDTSLFDRTIENGGKKCPSYYLLNKKEE